jgi:benzoyl-CoA-dihydrodiol lyase
LVNEVRHYYKRTLKRLDMTSRSLVAVMEVTGVVAEFDHRRV